MTSTDTDRPAEPLTGLQAIWANTLEPVAPPPWYRRVSPKGAALAAVLAGLAIALVVAAVTGAGAPPRHRVVAADRLDGLARLPDGAMVADARAGYDRNRRAASPYRGVTAAGYGAAGAGPEDVELLLIGLEGSFPDARRELDKVFGSPDVGGGAVTTDGVEVRDRDAYEAGPLGGGLDCATLVYPEGEIAACAWADGTVVGQLFDMTGAASPDELAVRALAIRTAVEVPAED